MCSRHMRYPVSLALAPNLGWFYLVVLGSSSGEPGECFQSVLGVPCKACAWPQSHLPVMLIYSLFHAHGLPDLSGDSMTPKGTRG